MQRARCGESFACHRDDPALCSLPEGQALDTSILRGGGFPSGCVLKTSLSPCTLFGTWSLLSP